MSIEEKIPGIRVFDVDGEKCVAVGSRILSQADVNEISKINNVSKILFYSIRFNVDSLACLEDTLVEHISVKHGNFSNKEFLQACNIPTIRVIDAYDTLVTDDCVEKINSDSPYISINVRSVQKHD